MRIFRLIASILTFLVAAPLVLANVIDGSDDRDALTRVAPTLGLSPDEVARIRKVSGYVGCLAPTPSLGSGALFLDNRHVITAAHILVGPDGKLRSKCFFKNQERTYFMTDLVLQADKVALGSARPKPGSNDDYAIVPLLEAVPGAEPFPAAGSGPKAGENLIVITGHPSGMARTVDASEPVAQRCSVRRVPVARDSAMSAFYRTDCDASGSSSGGMHLARIDGRLVFRGFTISTGPWEAGPVAERLRGAPYDEAKGSVTTALGVDGVIAAAGRRLIRK